MLFEDDLKMIIRKVPEAIARLNLTEYQKHQLEIGGFINTLKSFVNSLIDNLKK